jgi:hypothetical protein
MTPNKLEKIKSKVLKRVSFLKIYNIKSVSENALESKLDRWLEFNKNNFEMYWDWVITCFCCLQLAYFLFIVNCKFKLQTLPIDLNLVTLQGLSVLPATSL